MQILSAFLILSALILGETPWASPRTTPPPGEAKTVHWLVHELPPFLRLPKGDAMDIDMKKSTGPIADMHRIIEKALPEYDHKYLRIPFIRAETMFREKKGFCTGILQHNPDREQYMLFGADIAMFPPVGMIMRKSTTAEKYVRQDGRIDLLKTLENKNFRLGIVKGRFYTPEIMPVIQEKSPYSIVSDGAGRNLYIMLMRNRLDGVLGYYLEMTEAESQSFGLIPLQFIPVKEASEPMVLKLSCENSPWGKEVLRKVSKIAVERNFKEIGHQFFLSVLKKERREEYQKLYEARPQEKK